MNNLSTAEIYETKLIEALSLLSAVCRLTLTGTWEIQIRNNKGNPLDISNLSEEAQLITGYTRIQDPVAFFASVIPYEDQIQMQNSFSVALENNSVYSVKHRIIQGQTERLIYQRGELIFDRQTGIASKMLCICSDITNYQPGSQFPEDEGELAFITSHKLRAPLTNILALSDMLKNMSDDLVGADRIKELLLVIGEQAKHLDDAVQKLNKLVSHTNQNTFKTKLLKKVKELILIDDEPLANRIHTRLIGSMNPQLHVTAFTDPSQGMHFIKDCEIDDALLLLDINMPVMDAWACLDFMRENEINNQVIILSSSINPLDKQKASEYNNVVGFLNKPLTKENIKWLLEQH